MNLENSEKIIPDIDAISIASISGQNSVMQESFTELDSISDDAPLIKDSTLKATPFASPPGVPESTNLLDSSTDADDDLIELRTQATSPSFVSVHGNGEEGDTNPNGSDDDSGGEDAPPTVAPPSDYVVIYPDGGGAGDASRHAQPPDWALERALEGGARVILIYADPLGEHTARWIRLGNALHKSAALCSLASLPLAGVALRKLTLLSSTSLRHRPSVSNAWPNLLTLQQPVAPVSSGVARSALSSAKVATYMAIFTVGAGALCTLLYMTSWQFDPCSKYQVLTRSAVARGVLDESKYPPSHPIRRLLANAHALPSLTAPVVLIYKDDRARKLLHCSLTTLAATLTALAAYKLYRV